MTKTDYGEEILWCLVEGDAQEVAKRQVGRKLSKNELVTVRKALESGLGGCWMDIMEIAVDEAVEPISGR